MKHALAVALALLAVVTLAPAEDPEKKSVASLIEGLRGDDAARRDSCEAELGERWGEALEPMKAALAAEKDPEAKERLKRLVERGGPAIWKETVGEGLKRASELGWPCLVVKGDGPRGEAATYEGRILRDSLAAAGRLKALQGFVVVWVKTEGVPGIPDQAWKDCPFTAEGHGGVEMYVVHPKLGVCHYLRGWWKAERLAADLERARAFAGASSLEELKKLRAAAVEQLKLSPGADSCDNADAHPEPWDCTEEGCTLRRLALCYRQGDGILGADLSQKLPARMEGGTNADLGW